MEGADRRQLGAHQRGVVRAGHERLVQVQHIGRERAQRLERATRDRPPRRDRRNRPVAGHARAGTDADDAGLGRRAVAGGDDARVDAELAQRVRDADHLPLHAADQRERVRARQHHAQPRFAPRSHPHTEIIAPTGRSAAARAHQPVAPRCCGPRIYARCVAAGATKRRRERIECFVEPMTSL